MSTWEPSDQTNLTPEQRQAPRQTVELNEEQIREHIRMITGGFATKEVAPVEMPVSILDVAPKFRSFERLHSLFLGLTDMVLRHGDFAITSTTVAPVESGIRSDYDLAA